MKALLAIPVLLLAACAVESPVAVVPPLDGSKSFRDDSDERSIEARQQFLLNAYKALRDEKGRLQCENQLLQQKVRELEGNSGSSPAALHRERALRAKAEAEVAALEQERRELYAWIADLTVEQSKLEPTRPIAKLSRRRKLIEVRPSGDVAAAPIGGGK